MKQNLDPKIQLIADVIKFRGFQIETVKNGFQIKLGESDFSDDSVEFYVLSNNPDHVRAKLKINPPLPNQTETNLTDIQSRLQTGIDGVATIDTFHAFGNRGGLDIYYATVSMLDSPSPVIFFQKDADLAFQQLKGIDSKIFRQSLDNLGLARSSNLRLALTRIFRDASSASDLYKTVRTEMDSLVSDDDLKALDSIRKLEKIPPFIAGMVNLMYNLKDNRA